MTPIDPAWPDSRAPGRGCRRPVDSRVPFRAIIPWRTIPGQGMRRRSRPRGSTMPDHDQTRPKDRDRPRRPTDAAADQPRRRRSRRGNIIEPNSPPRQEHAPSAAPPVSSAAPDHDRSRRRSHEPEHPRRRQPEPESPRRRPPEPEATRPRQTPPPPVTPNGRGLGGSPRHPNQYGEVPIRPDNRVFADDLDRHVCVARHHLIPEGFPVTHRPVTAAGRMHVVAEADGALLYCDGAHTGRCEWPSHAAPGGPSGGDRDRSLAPDQNDPHA